MKFHHWFSLAIAALPGAALAQSWPECAQRGRDSLRIVWSRDGGATQERLLAEATSGYERGLIQEVWRRPGPASVVQPAIEADCNREMERRAGAGMQPSPSSTEGYGQRSGATSSSGATAAQEEARKRQVCANYESRMESLRTRERAGGSVATMERLNEERRRLQSDQSRAGC